MFAVLNVETGDFYSESPVLKKEAKRNGQRWSNSSVLPVFACRYARFKDALRRSQKLSVARNGRSGKVTVKTVYPGARCASAFFADYAATVSLEMSRAGRDAAPRGEPARHGRVGGEGTRLRGARGACVVLGVCGSQIFHFFAFLAFTPFFVASVVAPPECSTA